MKTLSKSIFAVTLALAFVLTSFTASAKIYDPNKGIFDPKKMSSGLMFDIDNFRHNALKFRLDIYQPQKQLVNISILDKEGTVVYNAFTSKTESAQLFDVSSLGYGEYTVEISTLGETASDKIVLEAPEYLRPRAFIKESEVEKNRVTIVSLNAESSVKVKIVNENGKVVFSDAYYLENYREHLDLNWLPKGKYTVSMDFDDIHESQEITVK
ncbi:DUF3244 domain-containing protein [Marinigracilibium pacificum]|uniref:Secreted protein (Por secretion system target) n=1 Tax=Marinigracilibium pacificum TaxID=2729599 RepID=A0A848J3G2_9BACT|nr:hypothetical protein [Marinigracilibium pacificum]NMM49070.1 hypothetical protein [Marinigracilibium pacificum]